MKRAWLPLIRPITLASLALGWTVQTAGCRCGDDDDGVGDGTSGTESTAGSTSEATVASSESTGSTTGLTTIDSLAETTEDTPQQCGDGVPVAGELCFASFQVVLARRATAALTLADFDGDGQIDLAAGHPDGVSIHLNQGNGAFAEAHEIDTP
jgi:hypothetical protein